MRKHAFHYFRISLYFTMRVCAFYGNYMNVAKGGKVPWNLSVNQKLKRLMQIHCAETGQEISALTETLYVQFLKEQKEPIQKMKRRTTQWPPINTNRTSASSTARG